MSDTPAVSGFIMTGSAQEIARAVFGPSRANPEQAHINAIRSGRAMIEMHHAITRIFPPQAEARAEKIAVERAGIRSAVAAIRTMRGGV